MRERGRGGRKKFLFSRTLTEFVMTLSRTALEVGSTHLKVVLMWLIWGPWSSLG